MKIPQRSHIQSIIRRLRGKGWIGDPVVVGDGGMLVTVRLELLLVAAEFLEQKLRDDEAREKGGGR